jgi:hypothetical protein
VKPSGERLFGLVKIQINQLCNIENFSVLLTIREEMESSSLIDMTPLGRLQNYLKPQNIANSRLAAYPGGDAKF